MKRSIYTLNIIWICLFLLISCGNDENEPTSATAEIDYSLNTPSCYQATSTNAIISSGDFFTGSTWNDPSVIFDNGSYVMYASSDVSFNGDIKIYRLTSRDSTTWTLNPTTPVLEKGSSGQWDDKSVETPSVVKFNGTYYMFYTGYRNNSAVDFEIGYATSSDGITWTKSASNPILTSAGGSAVPDDFDQFIVAEPGAVVFNNQIYLYFTAQGYITTADSTTVNDQLMTIGLVTSSDGQNFSSPQRVLDPNQTLFPRSSNWKGYSTPAAVEINNQLHLYVDVVYTNGSDSQRKLFHSYSTNGQSSWTDDSENIHERSDFSWSADEIRSPSVIFKDGIIEMWFAGNNGLNLGIGYSKCSLSK